MKHRKLFPTPDPVSTNTSVVCPYICDPGCPYNYICTETYVPSLLPPPPPPPTHHRHAVSPYVIIFVSLVASFFLFIWFYVIAAKTRELRNNRTQQAQPNGEVEEFLDENRADHPIWLIATVGLQQSAINAIGVCKYKKGDRLIEGTDCSVCLNEFQEDDSVRLLPKCNHAFHVSCIDTWLRSHINCPMCRACIVSETVTTAPLATADQNSGNSNSNVETNTENLETDCELDENQGRNDETSENRAVTEEGEIVQSVTERILKDSANSNENDVLQVVDDSGDDIQVVENDIKPLRRSVSLDSSLAETICVGLAEFCRSESGDCLIDEINDSERYHLAILLKQGGAYSKWSRLTASSSVVQCLHKGPVSMKRSFSCGGRFLSSRRNRSLNAILPL